MGASKRHEQDMAHKIQRSWSDLDRAKTPVSVCPGVEWLDTIDIVANIHKSDDDGDDDEHETGGNKMEFFCKLYFVGAIEWHA